MEERITPAALADRVRKLKERQEWTWDEAARRVGVTPGAIRQWRLGLIKHVNPAVRRRIEELELSNRLESQIIELDPEWRDTLRQARLSVDRILLSGNRVVIEHLKTTLEVLQSYVEATEERPRKNKDSKAKKGATGHRETD